MEAPERKLVVAFTGHRPDKLGGYGIVNETRDRVLRAILYTLRTVNPTLAISGMALGVDQWAASCCNHLGIPWLAAVPFLGQESVWPTQSQVQYQRLLKTAQEIRIISNLETGWRTALQDRNEWMVDNCDILIAIWDGSKGGTANCVHYAKLLGKTIVYIDPKNLK